MKNNLICVNVMLFLTTIVIHHRWHILLTLQEFLNIPLTDRAIYLIWR